MSKIYTYIYLYSVFPKFNFILHLFKRLLDPKSTVFHIYMYIFDGVSMKAHNKKRSSQTVTRGA